jgi:hypothetical protein
MKESEQTCGSCVFSEKSESIEGYFVCNKLNSTFEQRARLHSGTKRNCALHTPKLVSHDDFFNF